MPEIGEVARIVSYIRQHLAGKTLATVKAQHDEKVFGKVGTSAAEFEKALNGKKILDAKQQGKYFWLEMSSPPHPLMHFGMAGWFKIKGLETAYYKPTKPVPDEWPPKYWRFTLETLEEPGKPMTEAAFVDFRRFARVRLVDCPASEMRNTTPLKENGPDPVIDKDILTKEWLTNICLKKHIPIKALLLDQANVSGIGNWVGDEIMYHAKIHPEQYSNTLSVTQIATLHKSIHYVCSVAVETKSDSSKFPETWLFKYRWDKGKKDSKKQLPNGARIVFLKVGGRTSAVIPSVQKKTGVVAGDIKPEDEEGSDGNTVLEDDDFDADEKPKSKSKKPTKSKAAKAIVEDEPEPLTQSAKRSSRAAKSAPNGTGTVPESEATQPTNGTAPKSKKRKSNTDETIHIAAEPGPKTEPGDEEQAEIEVPQSKRAKSVPKGAAKAATQSMKPTPKKNTAKGKAGTIKTADETLGRRRSARVSGIGA